MRETPDSSPSGTPGRRLGRTITRLVAPAGVLSLAAVGLAVLFFRYQTLPRPERRAVVEGFLRVTLVGYSALLASSVLGTLAFGAMAYRAWRRRFRRPWAARLTLLCVASLVSLGAAEAAAGAWLAWSHRMPTLPTRFDPPDGRTHLVVLGGSTAMGHPYSPALSIGQVVAWQLDEALPGRRFQADILAFLGGALEDMHLKLARLTQRPAAVLIEAGHNEFPSRFEEERNVDLDEAPGSPALRALYRASLSSPLCRLVYQTLSRNRLDGPPPSMNRHQLIDAPMYTPSEAADVLDNFRRRLEAIVAHCETIGALPILVIEPGNEADYPPNRSILPPSATPADRRWIEENYEAAREAETRPAPDFDRARAIYRAMVRRQPGFAEAHFRLAKRLEHDGAFDEARRHYLRALDLDEMTFRATTAFQEVYREVAARHPSCILVDGPAELRAICPHGIVDDHAMHDGVHPSVRGIARTAEAVLRELRARRAFGWDQGDPPALDPAPVASHFGMDADRWRSVCDWGRSFYRWVAGFRFDPAPHLAKARRFEESAQFIAEGESPETIDFPPLSLQPLPHGTTQE